jgi:hypothetical protein
MSVLQKLLLAIVVGFATVNAARAEDQARNPVADALIAEAEKLRGNAAAWDEDERRLQAVIDADRALCKEWQCEAPPPLPSVAELELPVAYLADRLRRGAPGGRLAEAVLTALARSKDPRGLDFVLERHDVEPPREDRYVLAQVAGEAVPPERAAEIVTKALARKPRIDGDVEMLLLVLERHGDVLPVDVRLAARNWLSTYPRGPSNGNGERIWRQRLRLGDASDRDALLPHVAKPGGELLICLWVIRDAPMLHPRLAEALRARRNAISEQEGSYVLPWMRIALLVTDPEHEVASYAARIEELMPSVAFGKMPTEESREFDTLTHLFLTHDVVPLRPLMRRLVKEPGIDWTPRCTWLGLLVVRKDPESESLVKWWKETAPEPVRSYLDEYVEKLRSSTSR